MTRWAVASAAALGLVLGVTATPASAEAGGGRPVSGTYEAPGAFVNEPCALPEFPDNAGIGVIFTTTARLTSLGQTDISGIVCLHPGDGSQFGPLTLTTPRGTIFGTLEGEPLVGPPTGGPYDFELDYTIAGGTGRFASARGTLAIDASVTLSPFRVTGAIDGTIRLRH